MNKSAPKVLFRTIFDSFCVFLAGMILAMLAILVSFGLAVLLTGAIGFIVDVDC